MSFASRLKVLSVLALLAGTAISPLPAFSESAADRFKGMSVQELQRSLSNLQSGQHNLSEALAARRMSQIRRELARRASQQGQQQQGGQQQQQQQDSRANREARNYLRNTQDLGGMNDRQLGQTIRRGRNLMQDRSLRQRLQRQVRDRVQQARNERRRRQEVQQQQQQNRQDERAQQANRTARQYLRSTQDLGGLNDRRLNRAIANGRALANNRNLSGRLQDQVRNRLRAARAERQRRQNAAQQQQNQQQQQNANNANREARNYLRSTEDLRNLNDRQLQRAVRRGRALLQGDGLGGRLERRVRQRVQAARAERQRRQNANQQQQQQQQNSATADAAARRLLNDTRSASSLRDGQLRRRLQSARQIMGDRDLSRRLFRQVRRMARGDADELRARVARRNENLTERREDRQDARQLLRDRRPAHRLNDRQLQARIKSARDLLAGRSLRPRERDRIENILREARREKRNRLIAERQRRRDRLAERRRQNQVIIQIPRGNRYEDRGDIAAAEADGALLERQLVAPPKRRINRRYTRSELRRRPELREYMPAIEVDTIRFGFNEAFVREEEIPQLERIGEIIERIVTSNPDEVFVIEGHTDAVGSDAYNLGLSRKRADAVRDAMLRYFNIGSENIETIGYGERYLKINTPEEEAENRRVTIRRITPLLSRR